MLVKVLAAERRAAEATARAQSLEIQLRRTRDAWVTSMVLIVALAAMAILALAIVAFNAVDDSGNDDSGNDGGGGGGRGVRTGGQLTPRAAPAQ